jgi:pyruvate dehydrogenase E2 component (dihydrolipoamide acetyltransferase)
MAQWFTMPQLGSTMEEGLIVRWHKQEGDPIRSGEVLLEIETDKATMDVESHTDGVLHRILAPANTQVPIRQPIAIVGVAGEDFGHLLTEGNEEAVTPLAPERPTDAEAGRAEISTGSAVGATPDVFQSEATVYLSPRARRAAERAQIPISALSGRGTGPDGRVIERDVLAYASAVSELAARTPALATPAKSGPRTTPLAARIADDLGVDLDDLTLGLPGSRVRSEDVLRHAREAVPQTTGGLPVVTVSANGTATGDASDYSAVPFTGLRKRIADNVAKSAFTAPHVTLTIEVDMTSCAELRKSLVPQIEKSYGVRLSYTDLLVKAVARALDEHPRVNAVLVGDEIRTYRTKNIGVAVALEDGLVVPVVKRVESKSLGAIAAELKPLIDRARAGKFTPDDVSGGTFSITNLGTFGIDVFDPILVTGQAAILGVGRIAEKPAVVAGALAIRTMMNLCLSFDHRILDGVPAARFLQSLKELLESPMRILI